MVRLSWISVPTARHDDDDDADDILILEDNIDVIKNLPETFQNNFVLKFTYELNVNDKIPLPDVLIDANNDNFNTSVYDKPTSINSCILNCKSEYPH